MRIPTATYRLQFTGSFGFRRAAGIMSYLSELGISDVYASPVFKAAEGSTHGYDMVDPNLLDPKLGGREDFEAMMTEKNEHAMGWLQDVVPNHMAFNSGNLMLMDVLEKGPRSRFFSFFDIVWDHPDPQLAGKVMIPVLARPYRRALAAGKIKLVLDRGGFAISYYDKRLPLRLSCYPALLGRRLDDPAARAGLSRGDMAQLEKLGVLDVLARLPYSDKRDRLIEQARDLLWNLYRSGRTVKTYIDGVLDFYNAAKPPGGPAALDELLGAQYFRLALWKKASEQVNYRRFFYLNEYIGLCASKREVFDFIHQMTFRSAARGDFTGLRVDHIDGLYDPGLYLDRLRRKLGDVYIVVEKILQPQERLQQRWPVQGTTGYEFAFFAGQLFCRGANENAFDRVYQHFTGMRCDPDRMLHEKRKYIITTYMAGEVGYLAHLFCQLNGRFACDDVADALTEIIAAFGVYRTYVSDIRPGGSCRRYIARAVATASAANSVLKETIEAVGRHLLCDRKLLQGQNGASRLLRFVMKFQQLTGPAAAKGFEDTFLYCYNRLLSLNEVGGDPRSFGVPVEEFHRFNQRRFQLRPHCLNTTATHDTKRGEDVRARLNVLSEMPARWRAALGRWKRINRPKKTVLDGSEAPHPNDEYYIYQTILGSLPFDRREYDSFKKRIKEHFIKALREAKERTSWIQPNENYEKACSRFVDELLIFDDDDEFWADFIAFQKQIAAYGVYSSLSQLLIKMTAPGVPDFYQGSELWDLSLVDPDNRREVDYELRARYLAEMKCGNSSGAAFCAGLLEHSRDGRIKMFLIHKVLAARAGRKSLFDNGRYIPLTAAGTRKEHIICYGRQSGTDAAIIVAARFAAAMLEPARPPVGGAVWQDTNIAIGRRLRRRWLNAVTGEETPGSDNLPVGRILSTLPVALLVSTD